MAIRAPGRARGRTAAAPAPRLGGQQRGLVYSNYGEALFVKLTTADGTVGWGETLASVAPEVAATIVETLLAPQLLGRDPMAIEVLWADLYGAMRDRGHRTGFYIDALAGVNSALWDLRGKRAGLPVYALLGGPCQRGGPRAGLLRGVRGAPEAVARQVAQRTGEGFGALKLHVPRAGGRATAQGRRGARGRARGGAVHGRAQHAARGRGAAAGARPGAARASASWRPRSTPRTTPGCGP